jgi:enterochelin esterase family protein
VRFHFLPAVLACAATLSAQAPKPVALARAAASPEEIRAAIVAASNDTDLIRGVVAFADGPDLVVAVKPPAAPKLLIDEAPGPAMTKVGDLYFAYTTVQVGRTHNVFYEVDGKPYPGKTDIAAWPPDAYAQPGVPQGQLTEKLVHTSKIYPGMKSDYWVYTSAGYRSGTPAALMVWQDGEVNVDRKASSHTLNVIDNLTFKKQIPVMVHVFISPGKVGDKAMRSIEYDTVDDTYPRFLRDEILAEVGAKYSIRPDAYSRAIIGESSGAICAFNAAWFMPDQFARVVSRIGSFTSIQWKPNQLDGGQSYPNKIRKEPKRNIRVWLQDGAEDLENEHGSWPLQNIQMANSLKRQGYDFHLSFGNGTHTRLGGQVEAPAELVWIWRGYDPAKTSETFEMEASEQAQPLFRIRSFNR